VNESFKNTKREIMSDDEFSPNRRRIKQGPVDLIDYEDEVFEQKMLRDNKRESVRELPNDKLAQVFYSNRNIETPNEQNKRHIT
jgi:hypothetical protein